MVSWLAYNGVNCDEEKDEEEEDEGEEMGNATLVFNWLCKRQICVMGWWRSYAESIRS